MILYIKDIQTIQWFYNCYRDTISDIKPIRDKAPLECYNEYNNYEPIAKGYIFFDDKFVIINEMVVIYYLPPELRLYNYTVGLISIDLVEKYYSKNFYEDVKNSFDKLKKARLLL